MASKARALVNRWRAIDSDSRYHLVGAVLAVPCSFAVGIKAIRENPHYVVLATSITIVTGVATVLYWPVIAPTMGLYRLFSEIDKKLN